MRVASTIARLLLGLIFVVFGLNFWFHFIPLPPPREGSPAAAFMGAMINTGYFTVEKALEVLGGLLLLIGRFVNLGLAIIGPIVINIALFHIFMDASPMSVAFAAFMGVLALIALAGRADFKAALLNPR